MKGVGEIKPPRTGRNIALGAIALALGAAITVGLRKTDDAITGYFEGDKPSNTSIQNQNGSDAGQAPADNGDAPAEPVAPPTKPAKKPTAPAQNPPVQDDGTFVLVRNDPCGDRQRDGDVWMAAEYDTATRQYVQTVGQNSPIQFIPVFGGSVSWNYHGVRPIGLTVTTSNNKVYYYSQFPQHLPTQAGQIVAFRVCARS